MPATQQTGLVLKGGNSTGLKQAFLRMITHRKIQETNTTRDCDCVHSSECPSWLQDKETLQNTPKGSLTYNISVERLHISLCDKHIIKKHKNEGRKFVKVCCEDAPILKSIK